MSPQLVEAVLLHEDRWFWWHPGFNPYGFLRGAWVTYVRHGNRQGGSTITMQLARLLWPLNTRTPLGKLEAGGARHPARALLFQATTFWRPISTTRPTAAMSKAWARRASPISASRCAR